MTLKEATQFLAATNIEYYQTTVWADLGCGNGLFTKALALRLYKGSTVYAIDKSNQRSIASQVNEVQIVFQQKDFSAEQLNIAGLNGILMANSLHYVQDKKGLICKLKKYMLPASCFLVIEYDTMNANRWIPFPISCKELITYCELPNII